MKGRKFGRMVIAVLACTLVLGLLVPPRSAAAYQRTTGTVTGTIYFNRFETAMAATGATAAMALCSVVVVGGPIGIAISAVCLPRAAQIFVQAEHAKHRNMCLKVKYPRADPLMQWWDVYAGQYCR